ncbi:Protein ccc1 [Tilletia horrida]|nr:Protein ccc1 [Tilletia horrida]
MPCDNCACGKNAANDAVPLPRSASASASASASSSSSKAYGATDNDEQTPLLWKTTPAPAAPAAASPSTTSTQTACDRHHLIRRGGSGAVRCCKELNEAAANSAASPTFVDPDIIRDVIIGLSDGLSVPFALAAALSALGSTRIVVIGGLAELVSGAISMGVGGFLSAQAELDHYNNQARSTHERVTRSCLAEMKREVAAILEPFGLGEDVAEKVAERLANIEQQETLSQPQGDSLPLPVAAAAGSSAISNHSNTSASAPEHGLTPFLLKLGHGLEPISPSRAYISAATIGLSYFLGGLVPLIPYIILPRIKEALIVSIAITGLVLLAFGAVKHRFTGGTSSVRAYTWAAVSTLSVGGIAAAASWSIVRAIEGHE